MSGRPGSPLGVIFDLDGTLYESDLLLKIRMAGQLWRDLRILRHLYAARSSVRGLDFAGRDQLLDAFHDELGRRAGISRESASRWYDERFLAAFLDVLGRHAGPRPGLVPLLGRLRDRGIKVGVLSDYSRVAERLEAIRIPITLVDEIASSEDSGSLKPSPRSFLMMAGRLGLEPGDVAVVGDRDDMDGAGARAAGMRFVGIAPGSVPRPPLFPWSEIPSRLDLPAGKI